MIGSKRRPLAAAMRYALVEKHFRLSDVQITIEYSCYRNTINQAPFDCHNGRQSVKVYSSRDAISENNDASTSD